MEKTDKRCSIIRATLDLVAEQGFHGAPMALVAERAGVAAGTIYRYFESKDVLINEIYRFLEERLFAAMMEDYPETGHVRDRFLHVGRVLVTYWTSSPLEFRFMEQFHNSPYGAVNRREKLFGNREKNVILELFSEAVDAGEVKNLPVPVLCALMFGPLCNVCRDSILGFIELDEQLVGECAEACWDAVRK